MKADTIERARERVLVSKDWSPICARAIERGEWDGGSLVQNALAHIEAEDAAARELA